MSQAEALSLAENTLIGPYGLIRKVQDLLVGPSDPRIHISSSVLASLGQVSEINVPGHQGAAGFTRDEARVGAVGEALERYCSATWDWDALIYASEEQLREKGIALGMDKFSLYTEEVLSDLRLPLERWSSGKQCYWVEGKRLRDGARAFIPAVMVYIPYRVRDASNSDFFAVSVSSGQACHTDRDAAILSGLCEVIERDAFMITWMRRVPPRRIDYQADPILSRVFKKYFAGSNLQFHLLDITLDIQVPTVLAIAIGEGPFGRFASVGASTRVDRCEAAIKALQEATQGGAWARDLALSRYDWKPEPDFANVVSFEDHVRLYCEPHMLKHLDFLIETANTQPIENPAVTGAAPSIQFCLEELERAGLEAFAVDITSEEIRDLGFIVPKVLVPGLAHLTAVQIMPALASPRYTDALLRMGLDDLTHTAFNPIPHPFP
jgi:ribosomal protein S12 methylthiotransferase accessory factor